MHPAGGQAAFGDDQHEPGQPQLLGQAGVVEPDTEPRLAQGQTETQEQQQAGQADAMSDPCGDDRSDHHARADQQDEAQVGRRHRGLLWACVTSLPSLPPPHPDPVPCG